MNRQATWLLLLLLALSLPAVAAVPNVSVEESAIRVSNTDAGVSVKLPITSGAQSQAEIKLELLETNGEVVAVASSRAQLSAGQTKASISIPLREEQRTKDVRRFRWYRLRYVVSCEDGASATGIVALAAITPDLFELRTAHPNSSAAGSKYRVRVQSLNPVTRAPVAGVNISGRMTFAGATPQRLTGTTDAAGQALLTFTIPPSAGEDDTGELKLEGEKGKQKETASIDVEVNSRIRGFINTDKLLYQPGQSLHARALFLDSSKKPLANQNVEFELDDPQNQTYLKGKAKTNSFGIASVDWSLPDSAVLGDYSLAAGLDDANDTSTIQTSVRVSRYQLPNFTVEAKADRSYYLAHQDAKIEVAATYLFGKELKRGNVRLIREGEDRWDREKSAYVKVEAEEQKASLNDKGHATFAVPLEKFHQELASKRYEQFEDLKFSAYVTDPSSGRTEQRRFTIRISRDPIHVYVFGDSERGGRARFYLSAYYPDGQPAECDVHINQRVGEIPQFLGSIKTNRYGLAKVAGLKLITDAKDVSSATQAPHQLVLELHDKQGRSVTYDEVLYSSPDALLEVETEKSLYADGEPIAVSVRGSHPSSRVFLDVFTGSDLVYSTRIKLRNGKAETLIPYSTKFRGQVVISASAFEAEIRNNYEQPQGQTSVLYPHPDKLHIKVKPSRSTFRPGEEVNASLDVTLPSGSSTATALGITVVDKAVEERVRTDQDFGSQRYGFWNWDWWRTPVAAGGITRDDLDQLDLTRNLPDGMDLAAEVILYQSDQDSPSMRVEDSDDESLSSLFKESIGHELSALTSALTSYQDLGWESSFTLQQLTPHLRKRGIDIAALCDPWNTPYKTEVLTVGNEARLVLTSAGPDKRFDTADDFEAKSFSWRYFAPYGETISSTATEYFNSTGKLIRNIDDLRREVLKRGLDLYALKDPWGNSYQYTLPVSGMYGQVVVQSNGDPSEKNRKAPLTIWSTSIDYFSGIRKTIDRDLAAYSAAGHQFPRDVAGFDAAMQAGNNNFRSYTDPWGSPYDVRVGTFSQYSDQNFIEYQLDRTTDTSRTITQRLAQVEIWSLGSDLKPHTADDILLARYSQLIDVQTGQDIAPRAAVGVPLLGSAGAIEGIITDPSGAIVPNVEVIAEPMAGSGEKYSAKTDERGHYLIRNLPAGIYQVSCGAPGFMSSTVRNVPLHALSVTAVNIALRVAASTQTVEVTAEAAALQTVSLALVANTAKGKSAGATTIKEETFTPRLRQYFPETLYWAPSLVTDANGRARLKFKLADNVTTWKMSVIASTKEGAIGATDVDIQAFQPFFVDHEPPKVLTVGDRIELPVTIRNYLPKEQRVEVEMKPATWFELAGDHRQMITVPSGDSMNAVFPFIAVAAADEGKQQVQAMNRAASDAIEKPITVHPNGLPSFASVSGLVRGSSTLKLAVPENVIQTSLRGELKIYPNLLAHVVESMETSLERPYGCGEQTVSSTYPSVLYLRLAKSLSRETHAADKARAFARLGYERLLNYREADGGFSYWGSQNSKSDSDVALTAYVIRFLTDAREVVDELDPDLVPRAAEFLVTHQDKDGSWLPHYGHATASTTAYVANSLAAIEPSIKDAKLKRSVHEAVARALKVLADPHAPIKEPYAIAQYALAAHYFGDDVEANKAVEKLQSMATTESGRAYFELETNTPFYGWGRAGRLESTGAAVLALRTIAPERLRDLADSGTMYLISEKDALGGWYSGQATVNVIKALLASISGGQMPTDAPLTVQVNGQTVTLPTVQPEGPAHINVSKLIRAGENQVTISAATPRAFASAQLVSHYFLPWDGKVPDSREVISPGKPDGLRLRVEFDRSKAQTGVDVICNAEAERFGSRGHGMMIAEIGLPPGADVDRSSLDQMLQSSGWDISRYDVLPDRVLVYVWPHAGGVKFSFKFRVRYAVDALTAPSILYDYYNPDANVTLRPVRFEITN